MIAPLRHLLSWLAPRRPAAMQVAGLCLDVASGRVLLITSRGTGRWIIPKGWPMAGRSLADAAAQEAWEEAGVKGAVRPLEIGTYRYDKMQDQGFAIPIEVRIFLIEVTRLLGKFPEKGQRRRQWFTPLEASELVAEPQLRALLRRLPALLAGLTPPVIATSGVGGPGT